MHRERSISAALTVTALLCLMVLPIRGSAQSISPAEARTIAKDAYIYGFALVDNYRILYPYFMNNGSQEFKVPWNELRGTAQVFAAENEAVQIPPSDMPYSQVGADLRAEPVVITMPVIERHRYNLTQVIDLYSFNFAYIGSRAAGNDGGSFLLAGPDWASQKPKRVKDIIRPGTDFVFVVYRIEAFSPGDINEVQKPQAGYKVQGLHKYLGKSAPAPLSKLNFMKPITTDEERTSLEFFDLLNFVLRLCPANPAERDLMRRFAELGIGPQADFAFNSGSLSPEMKKALEEGETDAWRGRKEDIEDIKASSAGEELAYSVSFIDSAIQTPNNANSMAIFVPAEFPLVSPFWSFATYELPFNLFIANPPNRYLIDGP
jgi:hypothetical protein